MKPFVQVIQNPWPPRADEQIGKVAKFFHPHSVTTCARPDSTPEELAILEEEERANVLAWFKGRKGPPPNPVLEVIRHVTANFIGSANTEKMRAALVSSVRAALIEKFGVQFELEAFQDPAQPDQIQFRVDIKEPIYVRGEDRRGIREDGRRRFP